MIEKHKLISADLSVFVIYLVRVAPYKTGAICRVDKEFFASEADRTLPPNQTCVGYVPVREGEEGEEGEGQVGYRLAVLGVD